MKYITLLFLFFSFISCCSKKSNISSQQNNTSTNNYCPENGVCTLDILNNKSLHIKNNNENKPTYEIIDDINKKVVVYTFSTNQEDVAFDGGYNESVIFEINSNDENKTYIDEELKMVKMFYNKQKNIRTNDSKIITQGKLVLSLKADVVNFNLELTNNDDNQKIKTIKVIDGKL